MNYNKSNIYHTSFTVTYEELVRKVYGDRLTKLNRLLQHNPNKAKAVLGLDGRIMSTIKEVEGTNILGENLSKDMNTDKIPFTVHVYISDTSYVKEIQNAIVNYLENGNAFLIDKRKMKIKETADELTFINQQLAMMDTLKRKYNSRFDDNEKANATASSIYQFSYELYKKKQELIKKRDMPMNLYVIDDAIVPISNNRSYLFVLPVALLIGLIIYIGMVYLLIPVVRYKGD